MLSSSAHSTHKYMIPPVLGHVAIKIVTIVSLRLNSQLAQCKLHNSSTLSTREYLGEKRLFENIGEMFLGLSRTFSQLALVPSLPLVEVNETRESQRHIAETISQPAYVAARDAAEFSTKKRRQ